MKIGMETHFFGVKKGMIDMEKIVFIGAGAMTEAIIAGMGKQNSIDPKKLFVTNRSDQNRLQYLQNKYGISFVNPDRNDIQEADLIILATKPKDILLVMQDLKTVIAKDTAVLSVLAGVSIDTIEQGLGKRPIARSMPNTSAMIGKAASAVAWNAQINEDTKQLVLQVLESIGMVKEVPEDSLHAVTALSGSGPAYVYYLMEALEEASLEIGLTKDTSRALIIQTLEGAAAMLRQTNEEPEQLRKNVTSAGGTTEAGIEVLIDGHFKETVALCVKKAAERSRKLGELS